ncbi:hypothetical protein DFH28DRAFT_1061416 [Melampsora americana]|nr:hypothetical protein DFH28DRAFT_1061416 [Melampsora americana]
MNTPSQCPGCGNCFIRLKGAECGRCRWLTSNPSQKECTIRQCSSCGDCYRNLPESQCQSCAKSDPQFSPNVPLATPASAPMITTSSTASTLPQHLFQGGLLGHTAAHPPNLLPNHPQPHHPIPYGSQSSTALLNAQIQGSIRASQSGRRTIGQTKGKKKKTVDEEVEEESSEIEIMMAFWCMSVRGKRMPHGLTPRLFKINLNSDDWFWDLGYEVYKYYQHESTESDFPTKSQLNQGNLPLPEDFSSNYCIIGENEVLISKDSMASKLSLAQKTKKKNGKSKFGLIFNMKKYKASLPTESEKSPQSRKRKKTIKLSEDEDESDSKLSNEDSSINGQFTCSQPKRKNRRVIINMDDQDINVVNRSGQSTSDRSGHHGLPCEVELVDKEDMNLAPTSTSSVNFDLAMCDKSFDNTHTLAGQPKRILPYPSHDIPNWNYGWILSFITKNKEAVFKPEPVSFRVDKSKCIGSGRNMDCYKGELLLGDQVYHVVAKQHFSPTCSLSYYQCQAQSYIHAEAVIERFKRRILDNNRFTLAKKKLVSSLRVCQFRFPPNCIRILLI